MADESTRKSYHHGELPQALREATLAILAELGPEGFTLREAARRVGVNHRAVYRHFEDKRSRLAAVAEEGYRSLAVLLRAAVETTAAQDDVAERLVALCEGYLRFARREPARYQVMFGPRLNSDGRFPSLELAIQEALLVLREELRKAGPEASSLARRDAGITLWAAIHGFSSLVLTQKVPLSDRQLSRYVDTVMRPVVRGVLMTFARQ